MADDNNLSDENQNSDVTLEKLQADLDSAIANWKRTAADFENYKKHKERENKELLEFAKEVTVVKLLPTLDALEQALRHMPEFGELEVGDGELDSERNFAEKYQNWQQGANGIVAQLDKVLAELGVKKIEAIGKKFDPHFHEAVREVEADQEDGIIIDELQSGFILNHKVIRPSQVIISKKSAESPRSGHSGGSA